MFSNIKERYIYRHTHTHIYKALEDQALNGEQMEFEIERLAKDMIEKMDSKLWNDE